MAGLNTGYFATGPYATLAILAVIAVVTMIVVWSSPAATVVCPKELRRNAHGEIKMYPEGRSFSDMNAFQNWWYSVGLNTRCSLPILVGPTKDVTVSRKDGDFTEQTYAKTPINKVDDYELSRVFGVQQGDSMVINQDLNKMLLARNTDWADRPISSDERKGSYRGLQEGFTAEGDLTSHNEAVAQYGAVEITEDSDCKLSREAKKVARLVEKVYEEDKDYEPVVTQVGPNKWEVSELKPRYRRDPESERDRVVDTSNDAVKVGYRYPDQEALDAATDPYYKNGGWMDPREYKDGQDPYHGVVPNMARMFGPTFDTQDWTNKSPV